MTTIQITQGLYTIKPTPINICSDCVGDYVTSNGDLYEMLYWNDKKVRAFIDIDGCMETTATEEEFNTTNEMVLNILSGFDEWESPVSITTSSKYNAKLWDNNKKQFYTKHKLSYGVVFLEKYGSNQAIKQWTQSVIAPKLKESLSLAIPFYIKGVDKNIPDEGLLDYDNSVYDKNRRMRCVFTSKPNETRPRTIYSQHSVLDTMITYVPENCQALPEPTPRNEIIMPTEPIASIEPIETTDDTLRKVVMSLSNTRCDDRKDWLSIGIILYNEEESCDIWEEFSKQSSKYRWGECQRLWRGFRKGNLTQRSLWRMLKEDNPEVFKALCSKRTDFQDAFAVIAHVPFAQHFVNCKTDDYLFDVSSGWWFIQSNKTWCNSGTKFPPTLCVTISRTLYTDLEEYRASIRATILNKEVDLDANSWEHALMSKALKGSQSVLQNGFIKSVAEVCQGLYAEQTVLRLEIAGKSSVKEMMDANPMLFAFKDSVYDFSLSDGKAIGKRPIEPTDYITITCGYNYPEGDSTVRREIEEVLKGIWAKQGAYGDDGETYEYVMKILSSTLCGTRWMEAFYILTGSGRNGKGLLFELLQAVMGDYYYQLPVQVLTTKIDNPRAPNPDIANLVGKRLACSSEPEANEKLHEGTIKYMTGGDKLTGRALYGAPIQYKPQFGLFLQCNNVPNFNGITRGGVMRNRVIPFPFEFKSNPVTDREKKGNALIKDVQCKSAEWRDEMFLLLLEHFESVRGKSVDAVKMPKMVEERTNEYVSENNLIGCWWVENYIQADGEYVLSKEAFNEFKMETQSTMSDKQFKAGLEFNLVEVKRITKGQYRDKAGVANWRRKTEDEKQVVEPGSDDEKE